MNKVFWRVVRLHVRNVLCVLMAILGVAAVIAILRAVDLFVKARVRVSWAGLFLFDFMLPIAAIVAWVLLYEPVSDYCYGIRCEAEREVEAETEASTAAKDTLLRGSDGRQA